MSERERWIVYPLLFFALGAALRDKFTQHVTTDGLNAGVITCEELRVVDSQKPDRIVARLSSGAPSQQGNEPPDRFGVLVLIDSQNKELCGVTNNQLVVNEITCQTVTSQAVRVVDPLNQKRPLAMLSAAVETDQNQRSRRTGSLLLANSEGQELFGLANDRLQMRHIVCQGIAATEGIAVVDAANPRRTLAALVSTPATGADGKPAQRRGALLLNNRSVTGVEDAPAEEGDADAEPKDSDASAGDEPPSSEPPAADETDAAD